MPEYVSQTSLQSRLVVVAVVALLSSAAFALAAPTAAAEVEKVRVYVGTYTGAKSKGIYLFDLDPASGKLTPQGLVAETVNPSFLAIHPNRKFLYAVGEIGDFSGKKTGAVGAFAIDQATGKLTALNQQPSGGAGPCHLVVDRDGKNVLVANYGGGSVASLPIGEDGKLAEPASVIQHKGSSVNPKRQEAPHAHSINLDAANRFAVAADLGLDKVLVYRFDSKSGKLTANDPPAAAVAAGAGPRHFAFHPSGRYAYVINEILCTVTAFSYDAERGVLTEQQTISTLPHEVRPGYSTAEVQVHPSGKFLYGSNRGHDSIAVFQIVEANGTLKRIENEPTQGKTPRNFGIDPTGTFLLACNQASDTIVVFRINPKTGELDPTGHSVEAPTPVCVKMIAINK